VADLYRHHAGYHLGWTPCIGGPGYNNDPSELPDWEDVCEEKIEIITLTVNNSSYLGITIVFCTFLSLYSISRYIKRRKNKRD
jgi:hypothetical protein